MTSPPPTIENLEEALKTTDFDAMDYVNEILPNEESLSELKSKNIQYQRKAQKITASIRHSIHCQSCSGNESNKILTETKESISKLSEKISSIQKQSIQTQKTVAEICRDIQPLNNAQENLTATVTYLRRFQMMVTTLKFFEENVNKQDYQQCSTNLLALTSFFEDFKTYEDISLIKTLTNKFYDLKRQLRNQISTSLNSTLFAGVPGENCNAMCSCIDAFSDDFHSNVVDLFCDRVLSPGDEVLSNIDPLDVQKRYSWFIQKSTTFSKIYSNAFPQEWRISYQLARAFCLRTSAALREKFKKINFSNSTDNNNLAERYLRAFEFTVRFERKMAEYFSTLQVVPFDPNEKMPEFDDTASGIHAKFAWKKRMSAGIGETKVVPANEFIGMIASAFAPHIKIYLIEERKKFQSITNQMKANPFKDMDPTEHTMSSCFKLINSMKITIDKCSGFGVPQSLLELFTILKEELSNYVTNLTSCIPDSSKYTQQNLFLLCTIANTTSLLFSILGSLATKIQSLVKEEFKESIVVNDALDNIGNGARKQMERLAEMLVKSVRSSIELISVYSSDMNSITTQNVNKQGVDKFTEIMSEEIAILKEWLTNENLERLEPLLAQKIVNSIEVLFLKNKMVSSDQASCLIMSVKQIKDLIINSVGIKGFSLKQASRHFLRLEDSLTVICSPDIAMVPTYLGKFEKRISKPEFMSFVRLRNFGSEQEQELSMEFDKQLPLFQNHD